MAKNLDIENKESLIQGKADILKYTEDIADEIKLLSKKIYDNPEISFNEYQASKLLSDFLRKEGFELEEKVAGMDTAFKAIWQGSEKKPCLAFLCEYDALPKIGHGCGHHLIGPASAGAAVTLAKAYDKLSGSIVVLGTPAEESGGGKAIMVENGLFENVDAALMFHPTMGKHLVGKTGTALLTIKLKYEGKSSHAANDPHKGVNALESVLQVFHSINALRQHLRRDTRIHGIINNGGDAPNIVPDYAEAEFYLRSKDPIYLKNKLKKKFIQIAEAAALSTGAILNYEEGVFFDERKSNEILEKLFIDNMKILGENIYPTMDGYGSSDIGNVSVRLPTIHPYISISHKDISYHSREFAEAGNKAAAYNKLILATKALAMTGYDMLKDTNRFKEAWENFKETK